MSHPTPKLCPEPSPLSPLRMCMPGEKQHGSAAYRMQRAAERKPREWATAWHTIQTTANGEKAEANGDRAEAA